MRGMLLLIAVLIFILILLISDSACSRYSEFYSAKIIDRQYLGSSTSTGVGTAVGANGQVGTVVTSSYEPEKWMLIVSVNGQILAVQSDAAHWAKSEKGQEVKICYIKGLLSGSNYGWVAAY